MSYVWVGWILAGISIAWNIYQRYHPRDIRKLVYSVNPVITRIVSSEKASELNISFKDKQLGKKDVSAIQMAVWNEGTLDIRKEDIETPNDSPKELVIRTNPPVNILEAKISHPAKENTGFRIIDSDDNKEKGEIHISWDVLKKNDGASIQILFIGAQKPEISIKGQIHNQNSIPELKREIKSEEKQNTPTEQRKLRRNQVIALVVLAFIAISSGVSELITNYNWDFLALIFWFSAGLSVILFIAVIATSREASQPFDF
jgi:hypothetical protein